jgi:hypothetical protein
MKANKIFNGHQLRVAVKISSMCFETLLIIIEALTQYHSYANQLNFLLSLSLSVYGKYFNFSTLREDVLLVVLLFF